MRVRSKLAVTIKRGFVARWLLALAVLAIPSGGLSAQQPNREGFAFGLSLGLDQARDDLLVPMRWAGLGLGLRLDWDRASGTGSHDASLSLPVSLYRNRFHHKALALGLKVSYAYTRALGGERSTSPASELALEGDEAGRQTQSTPSAGPRFALGAHIRYDLHDGWYATWDEEHAYWFTALALGPRLAWSATHRASWRIGASLDVPAFALVARPPRYRMTKTDPLTKLSYHLIDTNQGMQLATLPSYFAVHARVLATRPRGSGLALGFDIDFATYDAPERVVTLTYRFHVSRRLAW